MVLFESVPNDRPVSGAGVRDTIEEEEEEEVGRRVDSTPGPSSDAGPRVDEATPSPTISSASESAPPPTARDLQRVKRRLIGATEHLRESLTETKSDIWENIEDEVQERQQESQSLQKLLGERIEMVSVAFRAVLDNHCEEIESQLTSLAASAHEAAEKLALNTQQCPSDWSEWSLLDSEEFQDLKARVETLEAGSPGAPPSGSTLAGEIVDAATKPLQSQLMKHMESYHRLEARMDELEAQAALNPGVGAASAAKKSAKSIVESKWVVNIGPLTDDKNAFRQWDEKMVNILTHLDRSYGPAIACIKDLVDRGRGPDGTYTLPDANRGISPDQITGASAVSSLTLAEMVQAGVRASDGYIDIGQ